MARRIANSTLNASTIDIMNVIRQNASYDYQQNVPVVAKATDIPRAGEVIYGTPAFANQFINALVNRIAAVRVQSATFNNPYSVLKKGYIEYGETIEEIFVNIAKGVYFTPEKAEEREFKRSIPDVRSAFHVMNWRVMYPVTIQDEDLKQAFLSIDGVQNLIAKIVESVYTAAEYDEFLLIKYMLIKAVSGSKIINLPAKAVSDSVLKESAIVFRMLSNVLPFMSSDYNEAGVMTTTPKERQLIFMDARFNAEFDVDVLASAFNMDKADFMGRLFLIDNWTSFDNARFNVIRAQSDGLEEVTQAELSKLSGLQAVIIDENWFQVYDNNNKFTEKYVASGLYWNYFYHTWKTVSYSPFANAIALFDGMSNINAPESLTVNVSAKEDSEAATVFTLQVTPTPHENTFVGHDNPIFVQTEALTAAGIAVHPYGAIVIPASAHATNITLVVTCAHMTYTATTTINAATDVDTTVTLTRG